MSKPRLLIAAAVLIGFIVGYVVGSHGIGRYTVIYAGTQAVKIDTRTGKTWLSAGTKWTEAPKH
jgi:hypothetical protein